MNCDPTINHTNLATAYHRGCRGDECKRHNTERVKAWRRGERSSSAALPERRKKVPASYAMDSAESETRRPDPNAIIYDLGPTLTFGEFKKARGYDPTTRSYAS